MTSPAVPLRASIYPVPSVLQRLRLDFPWPHVLDAVRPKIWIAIGVGALLLLYAVMAYTASLEKGVSFDEGEQLAVGYNIWVNQDYRIEGANGDFIKRWATLPYLLTRPQFVGKDDPYWRRGEPYELGSRFLFDVGNAPEVLLQQARIMAVLLGVAVAFMVFICARELFGVTGGFVSLGLFVFSPHMLAFGGLVSTDMSITLFLLASTCCIWRLLHRVTVGWLAASYLIFGLLLLAKLSALVILPITAVLVIIKLVAGRPIELRWGKREWFFVRRRAQVAAIAIMIFGHASSGWTTIWANYGFRYAASPEPDNPAITLRPVQGRDEIPAVFRSVLTWTRETRFLPQGFRRGVTSLLASDDHLASFMAGEWRLGGTWEFFPYVLWVKTRPALILLLLGAAVAWIFVRSQARSSRREGVPSAYALAPYLVLVGSYLAVALTEDINLGHRHVLPIYPSLYVLAGATALAWRWPVCGWLVGSLILWAACDSWAVRPHYLSYFGPQAGGPKKGYTHLVDSSLDWGMNLPGLKSWLDDHNPGGKEPVFLAYFGTDRPEHYGIRAQRLPGFFDWRPRSSPGPLRPGYYAISASLLQGVYTAAFGPWCREAERTYRQSLQNFEALRRTRPGSPERQALTAKFPPRFWADEYFVLENLRFARLCAWLRHHGDPPHHVGNAIFIWKLDYASLQAALLGPPVELAEQPLVLRRM